MGITIFERNGAAFGASAGTVPFFLSHRLTMELDGILPTSYPIDNNEIMVHFWNKQAEIPCIDGEKSKKSKIERENY